MLVGPVDAVLPLPDGFGFEEGAAFVVATSTAVNAVMQRGQLQPGETLLVHGAAGGVGLAAVETGKLLGARVIATASSDEKRAVARSRGADITFDYTQENFRDRVMDVTDGKGADVVFDPVGGDVFEQSLRCMAWGGRILVVGFASGRIPEIRMNSRVQSSGGISAQEARRKASILLVSCRSMTNFAKVLLGVAFKRNSGRLWRRALATTSSEGGMPGRMVRSQEPKEFQTA